MGGLRRWGGASAIGLALTLLVAASALAATLGWGRPLALDALPSRAPSNAIADLGALACATLRSCVAAGDYSVTAHDQTSTFAQPTVVAEAGGAWHRALQIALPANAATGMTQQASLTSIACPAAGSCVAVGGYNDRSGTARPMFAVQSGGLWGRAREIATAPGGALLALACRSARSCVAVGSSQAGSGETLPMTIAESGGVWGSPSVLTLPAHADLQQGNELSGVSCPGVGACVAVGYYFVASTGFNPSAMRAIVVTESGGRWGAPTPITLSPALGDAGSLEDHLNGVACPVIGSCLAVGSFDSISSSVAHPMAVSGSGGVWAPAVEVEPPAGAGSGPFSALTSVSCPASGSCVAVGQYDGRGQSEPAMAATGTVHALGPAFAIAGATAGVGPVSCPAPRSCATLAGGSVVSTLPAH